MNLHDRIPCEPPRSAPCPLALVGDYPKDVELVTGRPFSGDAKLFNQMLRMAGIDREACWVGLTIDEPLAVHDLKLIPQEVWDRHLPRLAAELEAAAPAVIVPMGSVALWALTGVSKISAARGAVTRATALLPGAKILPTFNPGYVRQQYKMLGTVVADLKKALAETRQAQETLTLSPRELWLDPTLDDLETFFGSYIAHSSLLSLDIETAKGQITHFGCAADAERAICVPFVDYRKPERSYWSHAEEPLAWDWVRRVCALPQPKLFQNGSYDCFYLIRAGLPVVNYRADTRMLHHALYPELPKSLAYMGSVYAQQGPWKLLADHAKAKDTDEKRDA
jgi:uracil-DNA glycosylase family 4